MRGLAETAVVITGAASGIGRATARRLAEEGVTVGILDLDAAGAQAAAQEIRSAGGRASAFTVDITDAGAVESAVASFQSESGPITGLVNNAGWDVARPFLETDPDFWQKVIAINLVGPLHVTKAVLTRMQENGRGRVVSVASDAGRVGSSGEAVYSACKGGIIAFSKSVARELARTGITLNCICPGPTDTPLLAQIEDTGRLAKALEKAIPMRRLAQPEDFPGLVAFFLSDDAAFITGQTISVSGGLTMHG
jgi:2-hydroxycyclohexanecarboxyl-CoA dehydrogenase